MVQFTTILFTLALFFSFYYGNFIVGISVLIIEVIILCLIPLFIKKQRENIRNSINNGALTKPLINVNKAPWYFLTELPDVTQIEAKKIVHLRRKYGKYKSLDDFFTINLISPEKREKIKKYICV